MATLVLTTVGGLIGGPVGAAIGGLIGQSVDRDVLFKPASREGPRLSDLSVQTSSYGSPIARLFGTMRVAGTVIWSTDLIESKTTSSSGKGQPSETTYSYCASFAVLLSARPILSIGRIWADGNLLRGAAGDFKTQTGFRLYTGGEDQDADPLIAAAEGADLAPAVRGQAYAVFEALQLADFGNRIPSLTFEVTADAGPVAAGAIAANIAPGMIDGSAAPLPIAGFSAYGDSMRGVLETLATATGAAFVPTGNVLAMTTAAAPTGTVADAGFAPDGQMGATATRSIAPIASVPQSVAIGYYDPARDYQTGLQRARRPGAGYTAQNIDMPAVLAAADAKAMAEAVLARTEAARETRRVALGPDGLTIAPGQVVTLTGEPGAWRVTAWSLEAMVLTLDLVRLSTAPAAVPADPGRAVAAPDLAIGTTIVAAFEAPPLDDTLLSQPRVLVAAAGTGKGWRRAALLTSGDGGASWTAGGATAAPAIMGSLAIAPGAAPATLVDTRDGFTVDLLHDGMALANADPDALLAGANLALLGDELLQFGRAEQIGAARWRLTGLLRGRRGTEAAIGTQAVGDRFVMIEADSVRALDVPLATLGGTLSVLASGVGDAAGPARADAAVTGVSVLPPAPVHLSARPLANGDVAVAWVRRSRLGWRWLDGGDAPLGEEVERYLVTIATAGRPPRDVATDAPVLTLAADDRGDEGVTLAVRQVGTNGVSPPATIDIPAIMEDANG